MSKRSTIDAKIAKNEKLISKLKKEIKDLTYESLLISDKKQQYFEEERSVIVSRRPIVRETVLLGFIKWKEDFKDESTGKKVTIERHQVVRQNGKWIV